MSSIPGSGRSPGGGHGNSFHYSCLENPLDRGAWRATVHGVTESQIWLKWLSKHAFLKRYPGQILIMSRFRTRPAPQFGGVTAQDVALTLRPPPCLRSVPPGWAAPAQGRPTRVCAPLTCAQSHRPWKPILPRDHSSNPSKGDKAKLARVGAIDINGLYLSHNSTRSWILWLSPFYQRGNWGTQRWSNLPVT